MVRLYSSPVIEAVAKSNQYMTEGYYGLRVLGEKIGSNGVIQLSDYMERISRLKKKLVSNSAKFSKDPVISIQSVPFSMLDPSVIKESKKILHKAPVNKCGSTNNKDKKKGTKPSKTYYDYFSSDPVVWSVVASINKKLFK